MTARERRGPRQPITTPIEPTPPPHRNEDDVDDLDPITAARRDQALNEAAARLATALDVLAQRDSRAS